MRRYIRLQMSLSGGERDTERSVCQVLLYNITKSGEAFDVSSYSNVSYVMGLVESVEMKNVDSFHFSVFRVFS